MRRMSALFDIIGDGRLLTCKGQIQVCVQFVLFLSEVKCRSRAENEESAETVTFPACAQTREGFLCDTEDKRSPAKYADRPP